MIIIPAVDIKGGQCVRLLQGRMNEETVFSDDPSAMAIRWADEGAALLHVVDLDGAIEKTPVNAAPIKKIVQAIDIPVQLGGGIRNIETVHQYMEMGVNRVVIGSAAVKDPDLVKDACKAYPDRIVVGIDARGGMVAIEGWTSTTQISAVELAKRFEDDGVAAINFTDIDRDGMRTGPNIEQTKNLATSVSIPVVASGGVSNIDDIKNLLPLEPFGVVGVITGRALYDGSLTLKEAIAATKNG